MEKQRTSPVYLVLAGVVVALLGYGAVRRLLSSPHSVPSTVDAMASPVVIPLTLEPQPEGGYTVTSPIIRELLTEGESVPESIDNAWDALLTVLDGHYRLGRPLPLDLPVRPHRSAVLFEPLVTAA